jgi:hypothetical protein
VRLLGLEVGRGFERELLDVAIGARRSVDRDLVSGAPVFFMSNARRRYRQNFKRPFAKPIRTPESTSSNNAGDLLRRHIRVIATVHSCTSSLEGHAHDAFGLGLELLYRGADDFFISSGTNP